MQLWDYSQAYISADVSYVEVHGESTSYISGNAFISAMDIYDQSQVNVSDGIINWINSGYSSQVLITGGIIETISSGWYDDDDSIVTIVGGNFSINGIAAPNGQYFQTDFEDAIITGTLANGDPLNASVSIRESASIVLVPEPATLLLFGLVGLVLRRKRKE